MSSLGFESRGSTNVSPLFGTLHVSGVLAAVIGVSRASRLEATERLHAYVAKHNLSRKDGTVTLDAQLKSIFAAPRFATREWATDAELFEAVARNLYSGL